MDQQAQVHTGYVFPSAGVRVLIPLVVSAFMEEASGLTMHELSDYNVGVSVGSVAAAGFSMADGQGRAMFKARDVLLDTFVTAYLMFNRNPNTVLVNNAWRDIDALRKFMTGPIGRQILSYFEHRRPSVEDARYNPAILEATLKKKFGDSRVGDATRTFFIIAHGISDRKPTFFTNIDLEHAPRGTDRRYFMDRFERHRDIAITDAIMAATAIPGFIGYRCVDSISKHFMDPGSFAAQSFFCIMRDMHDLAVGSALEQHAQMLSSRPAWKRATGYIRGNEHPPEVVSRLVYFGIGDETNMDFDVANERGVLTQAGDIVRAAGDHVRSYSFEQIRTRFDEASLRHTGASSMRIIDSHIGPVTEEDRANFPSDDIKDGRLENLMRLLAFGRKVVIENRNAIADELVLRAKTLQARGLKTEEEIEIITRRADTIRDDEAARAICDKLLVREEEVASLFEHYGVKAPALPVPANDATAKAGWGRRLASSVMSVVV